VCPASEIPNSYSVVYGKLGRGIYREPSASAISGLEVLYPRGMGPIS